MKKVIIGFIALVIVYFGFAQIKVINPSAFQPQKLIINFNSSAKIAGDQYSVERICGSMRLVSRTGSEGFIQGSPEYEVGRNAELEGQFVHVITRNLAVMETEITRQMWQDLKAMFPRLPNDPTDVRYGNSTVHPVQNASWCEAILFANFLSRANSLNPCYYTDSTRRQPIDEYNYNEKDYYCDFTANGYRLPTEGEWEYMARGGTCFPYSVTRKNKNIDETYECVRYLRKAAVFCWNNKNQTEPVACRPFNPWHIADVHGNVAEWCWDKPGQYPSGKIANYSGAEETPAPTRVARGGYWNSAPEKCRSASRAAYNPKYKSNNIGFRLVRTVN